MSKKSIWISYDLGIKGDYPGLYAWLDNKKAKEAGNSIAFFNYDFNGSDTNLLESLKEELESAVNFKPGDRIYIIRMRDDIDGNKRISGRFIIGNRKASPWEGYGHSNDDNNIDGDD